MKIDDIISSIEMTLKEVEEKLHEIKETDRSDPKHYENQKNYDKFLEEIANQLKAHITHIKELRNSRDDSRFQHLPS